MKKKTEMNKKFQRNISRILSFIMIFSILSIYGCKEKKIEVEDYPMPVEIEETLEETGQAADKKSEEPKVSDEDLYKPEVNTLKEDGKYVYNPAVIPDWVLMELENEPHIVRIVRDVLIAIDNAEEEFVLDEDIKITDADQEKIGLALYYSTPLYSQVLIMPNEDGTSFTLSYFPQFEENDEGDYSGPVDAAVSDSSGYHSYYMTGTASSEEAKEIIDSFRDYVTNLINNNLTSDMSDKEMAAVIYKQLVMDSTFSPKDTDSYQGFGLDSFYSGNMFDNIINQSYSGGMDFIRVYQFILTQLHIDNRLVVGTSGFFTNEIKDKMGDKAPISYYWCWLILELDGEYYNSDIILEKLMHDIKYGGDKGIEPDMSFFAMSDKKRIESYKIGKTSVFYEDIINPASQTVGVPDCPEDYTYR